MKFLYCCLCLATLARVALPVPVNGFVFPDDGRRQKKLEPVITPPVLPVLEHLERDPSTLVGEHSKRTFSNEVKPRYFGGGFNVRPSENGGLTASISSSLGGVGGTSASHSASQSFSFGFNEGFSASHSGSQSSSFGFGNFAGSQASSQAASFSGPGGSASGAASSASSIAGGFNTGSGNSGSQSASSAFGFNQQGGFGQPDVSFGDGLLDIRHRGVPGFPFPSILGKGKTIGASSFRKFGPTIKNSDDFVSLFISN